MDEFDKYLSQQHPENEDPSKVITNEHLNIIFSAVQSMFYAALGESNQLHITLTRVQPNEKPTWAITVKGVLIVIDDLEEMISAISRLIE